MTVSPSGPDEEQVGGVGGPGGGGVGVGVGAEVGGGIEPGHG